jgi:RNA polymerase sigma-70 factor (ECF subfamily)
MSPTGSPSVAIVDDDTSFRQSIDCLVRTPATAFLKTPFDESTPLDVELSRGGENKTGTNDDGLSSFMSVRPRLFSIAYRILGSTAEAEDIAQDVWVRWQTVDRSLVRDAAAFLVTTATRLAINVMQSARSRRETYDVFSLPEPVDASADSGSEAERSEALKLGVLILLEKLSPTERAAYVLREAFDYTYRDIANVLRLEEANARQVVTRARQQVASGRKRRASSNEQERFLDSFIDAAQRGNVSGFERLVASDIVSKSTCRCEKS